MTDYLIFQLTSALGAMGELAGYERRGSLTWPGRSALLGLIGGAMGLRRDDDFSTLDALKIGVAIFDAGGPLRDFHTIETIPSAAAKHPQSRPEALRAVRSDPNTMITLRDYRTAPLFGIAIWDGPLDDIRQSLERPVFLPYFGRKSCPLAAPLAPRIVDAESAERALALLRLPPWRQGAVAWLMASDEHPDAARIETRHDIAIDRCAWHFAPRQVAMQSVHIAPEVAE